MPGLGVCLAINVFGSSIVLRAVFFVLLIDVFAVFLAAPLCVDFFVTGCFLLAAFFVVVFSKCASTGALLSSSLLKRLPSRVGSEGKGITVKSSCFIYSKG